MDNFILLAAGEVFSLDVILVMAIGTFFGIIAGAIPGFTVTMGVVLAFPFTFAMDPIPGISLMISILVGGYSGGVVSGILLGIPGTPSSIATVFDGHPMAKSGQPGRALGLGLASSFLGNIIGLIILVSFAPLIAEFSLRFGPWEVAAIVLFALTLVGSLSQGAMLRGCTAAGLGIIVATMGIAPSGQVRFSFGIPQLTSGVELLPVLVGAFAFSQLLTNAEKSPNGPEQSQEGPQSKTKMSFPGRQIIRDLSRQKLNILRSSALGAGIGAIPAVGATTSTFVSYDQAKRFSKEPEKFGKGHPSGIVAAETANSGTLGGVLIPTLTLGIPGDITMAIMYGVLLLYGLQPGPALFAQQPVLMGSIYLGLFISGVLMILLMLVLMRYLVRIATIPMSVIIPLVLMLATVGMFALNNRIFDVVTMFVFGISGYFMVKAGVPLTPFILGVILGPVLETNIFRAIQIDPSMTSFATRPIAAIILLITVLSVVLLMDRNYRSRRRSEKE